MATKESLYERLGGEEAIMAAVDIFYKKLLDDPLTKPFFDDTDMKVQARKQIAFMAWAFGGPEKFKGRDLRSAHAHLVKERGLSDEHFDAVAKHLSTTLHELKVPKDLHDQALEIVASTRDEVLDR